MMAHGWTAPVDRRPGRALVRNEQGISGTASTNRPSDADSGGLPSDAPERHTGLDSHSVRVVPAPGRSRRSRTRSIPTATSPRRQAMRSTGPVTCGLPEAGLDDLEYSADDVLAEAGAAVPPCCGDLLQLRNYT